MSTTAIIVIVVVCVLAFLAIVAVYMAWQMQRSKRLREEFGPEYEHAVEQTGDRGAAEKELRQRKQRIEKLHIVPLSEESRQKYADRWKKVQARFVDDPIGATIEADDVIGEVMQERGYPVSDFDQRIADVSVEHPDVANHYRAAHGVAIKATDGTATTEDLRQALLDYRALFEDLLDMRVRAGA